MNEQLQQALAGLINKTVSGVEAVVSFLQAEIPDVIHQLLMWKLVENLVVAVMCFAVIAGYSVLVRSYIKNENEGFWKDVYGDISVLGLITLVLGGIAAIFSFTSAITSLIDALQISIAPKVYLIEYSAKLTK